MFLCFCIAMAGRCCSKTPSEAPSKQEGSISDSTNSNGPTLILNYSKETFKKNPILAFAYFIPLISPALVDREISVNNEQQEGIISYEKTVTSKSFYAACEIELSGKGFHKNTFDSAGIIARNIGDLEEGEPLTNMLDYIKFEGDGIGLIEVKGTITGSTQTVTEVDICFNAKGQKSPVTIGLYSIKPQDGQYKYENRYNELIARVSTLTFRKSEENNPRMGIEIASIHKKTEEEGFWSKIKGLIANFFIKPLKVDKLGNDTMLNFGYAILNQKPAFTFPKAKNIKENRIVAIDPAQK
jgi:hypothetical protein